MDLACPEACIYIPPMPRRPTRPDRSGSTETPAEIGALMGAECLALRARMLSRVVTQIYEEALRPLGLRPSQHSILAALAMMEGPRPKDVAAALRLEQSTVSRNLAVMIRSGWVEERPAEDDRTKRVGLTPAGEALLQEALPLWRRAQAKARARLSDAGAEALRGLAGGLMPGEPPAD